MGGRSLRKPTTRRCNWPTVRTFVMRFIFHFSQEMLVLQFFTPSGICPTGSNTTLWRNLKSYLSFWNCYPCNNNSTITAILLHCCNTIVEQYSYKSLLPSIVFLFLPVLHFSFQPLIRLLWGKSDVSFFSFSVLFFSFLGRRKGETPQLRARGTASSQAVWKPRSRNSTSEFDHLDPFSTPFYWAVGTTRAKRFDWMPRNAIPLTKFFDIAVDHTAQLGVAIKRFSITNRRCLNDFW